MLSSYLSYILKRKNEFHIHSPFVFALYTKVIRGHQCSALKELGIERQVTVPAENALEQYLGCCDESIMFIVNDIHQNKNNEAAWNTICGHPDVILTIDLYHKGLLFYREGMEKQEFVLRI